VKKASTKPGFALLLVMILVATGVILGLSYLSVASLKVRMSRNYQLLARARYLAESGLEHAQYVLRLNPDQFTAAPGGLLGPFYADGSSDGYVISCTPDASVPGRYVLTSVATVGQIKRTSSMTVSRSAGPEIRINHAVVVGGGLVWLPWDLTITGDFHANGFLLNSARINGNATSTGGLWDPWGRISGFTDGGAEAVDVPSLNVDDYKRYFVDGRRQHAARARQSHLTSDDPLAGGGVVTASNTGGVLLIRPRRGDTVTLHDNLNFTGTLVIDGNVRLDGSNITLTAVNGFPAIVATGSVEVTNDARNVTINGVVCAEEGIVPASFDTSRSSTTINGALVSAVSGYSSSLRGNHVMNYSSELSHLRDLSAARRDTTPQLTVLDWND